jgi:hypothetical protein
MFIEQTLMCFARIEAKAMAYFVPTERRGFKKSRGYRHLAPLGRREIKDRVDAIDISPAGANESQPRKGQPQSRKGEVWLLM